jgi:protein disulfide-isomerase
MRWTSIGLALSLVSSLALSMTACQRAAPPASSASHANVAPIAWREGDVDDALAEAKETGKPVMLYWGAKWCPPCNQLKSTVFQDPAFIEQTRQFVPVHLDGDTTGAQRWGERFGIRGYPTVIILRGDGSEIARLSGVASGLPDVLRVAAGRSTSIETLLAKADKAPGTLTADDWRLLSAFDWQDDPRHFADSGRAAVASLASAAPDAPSQRRFALLALAMGVNPGPGGKYALTPAEVSQIEQVVPAVPAHDDEVVANRLTLSYAIPSLVAALPDAARRASLGASLTAALDKIYADAKLPIPDRMNTVNADILLAQAGGAPVPPPVLAKVRARVAWADGAAKEAMVRQSVISDAAALLHAAGDDGGAKSLLEAELKRSASPYYYMLDLAGIAEDEKDGKAAIDWAHKAYDAAEGPATRVQWAIEYSKTVLRQAPTDKAAVEASAEAVIAELGKNPDDYYQRTRIKVAAWGGLLQTWSAGHHGRAVLARLDAKMSGVSAKQGEAAASCRQWSKVG